MTLCPRCGDVIQTGQLTITSWYDRGRHGRVQRTGRAHLACPTRRQIAHDRRMGRRATHLAALGAA